MHCEYLSLSRAIMASYLDHLCCSLLWGVSCKKDSERILTKPALDNASEGKEGNGRSSGKPELLSYQTVKLLYLHSFFITSSITALISKCAFALSSPRKFFTKRIYA